MNLFDQGWWNCFLSYTDELAQIKRDFDMIANAQLAAAGVEKERIGCILCPMSSYKHKIREMKDYPHVVRNWLKTIKWLKENKWIENRQLDADEKMAFNWWISGKSFKQYYADEVLQQKIDF